MSQIAILGATGMLGSAVLSLAQARGLNVWGTTTDIGHAPEDQRGDLVEFRYDGAGLPQRLSVLGEDDYVVNCVGLIRHQIDEHAPGSRLAAVDVNARLPHALVAAAAVQGFRVIQIATDCVYSGRSGGYIESAPHDALDVYGKSKSLGEVPSDRVLHLRSSIVGRELRSHLSLIDWVLSQPSDAAVDGYLDHLWNGVSTVAFARVALGVIENGDWQAGVQHLVPSDAVSKAELLQLVTSSFGRRDIRIMPVTTDTPVNRTLATVHGGLNDQFWSAGGYSAPPSIADMMSELARVQRGGIDR